MTLDKDTVEYGIRVFETIGFPAIVACWHMARTDRRLDENTKALADLLNHLRVRRNDQ